MFYLFPVLFSTVSVSQKMQILCFSLNQRNVNGHSVSMILSKVLFSVFICSIFLELLIPNIILHLNLCLSVSAPNICLSWAANLCLWLWPQPVKIKTKFSQISEIMSIQTDNMTIWQQLQISKCKEMKMGYQISWWPWTVDIKDNLNVYVLREK